MDRATETLKQIELAIKADAETPGIRAPRELRNQLIGILNTWAEGEENA